MRPRPSSPDSWLVLQQLKERREVTLRLRHTRQAAPDVQPRDCIVSLRLGECCFCHGDLDDCRQARLITRLLLLLAFARGLQFDRGVLGNRSRAIEHCAGFLHLRRHIAKHALPDRIRRIHLRFLRLLLRAQHKNLKRREGDLDGRQPVICLRGEPGRSPFEDRGWGACQTGSQP